MPRRRRPRDACPVMLTDARNLPDGTTLNADICIVGADAFQLAGRRRQLGGMMGDWGANSSLLQPEDFDGSPVPGMRDWPLAFDALDALDAYAQRIAPYVGVEGATTVRELRQTARAEPSPLFAGPYGGPAGKPVRGKLYVRGSESSVSRILRPLLQAGSAPSWTMNTSRVGT